VSDVDALLAQRVVKHSRVGDLAGERDSDTSALRSPMRVGGPFGTKGCKPCAPTSRSE
jgi:hypothetical protein